MNKTLLLIILFVHLSYSLFAQNNLQPTIIEDINVTGLKTLSKETFLQYLPFRAGDVYDKPLAVNSLKDLFQTGSFLNASISYREAENGNIIILYAVEERPWVNSIEFRGNDDISDSSLKNKMTTTEKSFLNDTSIKKDIEAILMQYQTEGFIGTQVDTKTEKKSNNETKIIFSIIEGTKLSIQNINVFGTNILSSEYLKSNFMTLKEPFLFNLLKYPLIPQAFEIEKQKLIQLAFDKGFIDFRIIRSEINASISYKPTLDHLKKNLRQFGVNLKQLQLVESELIKIFTTQDKKSVLDLVKQLRYLTKPYTEKNKTNSQIQDSVNLFLRAIEVEITSLFNISKTLSKQLPSNTSFNAIFTNLPKSGYTVNFYTTEGSPYIFTGVEIIGSSRINAEKLKKDYLTLLVGTTYNDTNMQEFKNNIAQNLRDQGYFGVVIQDKIIKNELQQTIKHRYTIQEGQKMHIHKMYIQGNEKTKNFVVDRELRIKEGGIFNQTNIATSQRLLQRTGYFENIEILPSAGPEENLLDLTWRLQEKRTGNLQLGGGYGTETGISVFGSISETNFLGYGINATAKLSFGQYERGIQASFSSNYISYLPVGWTISTGYDWIRQQASPRYDRDGDGVWDKIVQKEDGKYYLISKGDTDFGKYFDANRTGSMSIGPGSINPDGTINFTPSAEDDIYSEDRYFDRQILFLDLGTGYSFADFWSVNITQSILFSKYGNPTNINLDNLLVDDYYSLKADLMSKKWSYTSHIDLGLYFNNTNSPLSPSEGITAKIALAFYGIEGGFDNFLRIDAQFAGYLPIIDLPDADFKLVWATGAKVSSINPLIGNVQLHYENQIGFNTMEEVRGWGNFIDDSDLLGLGKVSFGTELRASIPNTNNLLWIVAFFDGGNISDKVSKLPTDFTQYLYSTGVGIRLDFPSFPIRFYLAQKLKWDKYFFKATEGISFEFSVSSAF